MIRRILGNRPWHTAGEYVQLAGVIVAAIIALAYFIGSGAYGH
jgi:hypothetical protein